MNYTVKNKELNVYDSDGNLMKKAEGIEFAYLTVDKKGLVYLCNCFGQLRGDLYYLKDGDLKKPKLLAKKIRIVDFSNDYSFIVGLENYSDENYKGNLCIVE